MAPLSPTRPGRRIPPYRAKRRRSAPGTIRRRESSARTPRAQRATCRNRNARNLVGRRQHPAGRRGSGRGRKAQARHVRPRDLGEAVAAVQGECKPSRSPPSRRSGRWRRLRTATDRRGVVGAAGIVARRHAAHVAHAAGKSIMWSSACTPTAVSAPPGASSGAARQLSSATNCAVDVVCWATMAMTFRAARPALWRATRRGSMEAPCKPDGEHDTGLARGINDDACAGKVQRDRLFDTTRVHPPPPPRALAPGAGCAASPARRRR